MSDTSVTTTPPTPTAPPPLPNDSAARSPTGEILEPSQIQATTPEAKTPATTPTSLEPTSTPPKDPAKPADAAKAPEAYTDFTAPEGYTLDAKTIDAVMPIFKELGLTQDQAQKLVTFHASQLIEAAKAPEATM